MSIYISLLVGFLIGYLSKGITIKHSTYDSVPTEFNPSYADDLPKEVREHFDQVYHEGRAFGWQNQKQNQD